MTLKDPRRVPKRSETAPSTFLGTQPKSTTTTSKTIVTITELETARLDHDHTITHDHDHDPDPDPDRDPTKDSVISQAYLPDKSLRTDGYAIRNSSKGVTYSNRRQIVLRSSQPKPNLVVMTQNNW